MKKDTVPDGMMQDLKQRSITGSFRGLMAAVISRALADIAGGGGAIGASDHVRDEAMAWINGPECEAFCLALDADYRAIREKAVALYRRFLEKAEEPRNLNRKTNTSKCLSLNRKNKHKQNKQI